jgi:hypothetical protein
MGSLPVKTNDKRDVLSYVASPGELTELTTVAVWSTATDREEDVELELPAVSVATAVKRCEPEPRLTPVKL